jgi:hypothetical protein
VPKAYVILAAGHAPADRADIFRFLRQRVSGYKLVRRIFATFLRDPPGGTARAGERTRTSGLEFRR